MPLTPRRWSLLLAASTIAAGAFPALAQNSPRAPHTPTIVNGQGSSTIYFNNTPARTAAPAHAPAQVAPPVPTYAPAPAYSAPPTYAPAPSPATSYIAPAPAPLAPAPYAPLTPLAQVAVTPPAPSTPSDPATPANAPATRPAAEHAATPATPASPAPAPSVPSVPPLTPAAPVTVVPPTAATPTTPAAHDATTGGPAAAPPSAAPAAELPPVTQPFVASIVTDRVYVRSGPGTTYYEIGLLNKGDLVYVVGTSKGWYQILPPNGTFCLIAKEFVDVDPTGTRGTVKNDYVNVRAGTATSPNRDPFAILTVVRKGTSLQVIGTTEKYYQIAPPERAFVYINPQFIAKANTDYKIPDLKLPQGATGPTQTTVTTTTPPPPQTPANNNNNGAPTIELTTPTTPTTSPTPSTPTTPSTPSTPTASGNQNPTLIPDVTVTPGTTTPPPAPDTHTPDTTNNTNTTPIPVPVPAVQFSQTATQKFNELNTRFQEEERKPIAQRNVDDLIKAYKDLLAMENLSPSVKMGSESRIAALEKTAAIQRLEKENAAAANSLVQQREALQQQYAAAEKAIAEYQSTGPYIAQGTLQTSTIVQGKYTLVNPATGRVVAYVDPQSEVDISSLLGKYIGVRGTSSKPAGSDITLIRVTNATLMAPPAGAKKD